MDFSITQASCYSASVKAAKNMTGVISTTQKGAGYMDYPDPKKPSVYFEPGTLNTALNGDTVEAQVSMKVVRGVRQEVGVVVRVV